MKTVEIDGAKHRGRGQDNGTRVKQRTFINALSMAQSYEHADIIELLERHVEL